MVVVRIVADERSRVDGRGQRSVAAGFLLVENGLSEVDDVMQTRIKIPFSYSSLHTDYEILTV